MLSWDRENCIFPKVTKMGSIFGHKIDHDEVKGSEASGTYSLILTQVKPCSHMPPMYLQRSRRCCLRYYSDIWGHNANGSRFTSGMPAKSNSCQLCKYAGGQDWHGLCCRRPLFSYRNDIVDNTSCRVGVIWGPGLRLPPPGVCFPTSDSFGICAKWDAS